MRVAVALPGLERDSLLRRGLEATLAVLVDVGMNVEGFAEHDRLAEAPPPFPIFHYLRMPERHRAARFDVALYPLGRDASPYQAAAWLMKQFPSVVWLFDSVLHHLALGGIGLMGRWRSYRSMVESAYGDSGAAIVQTVARNWGTNSVFARYDLVLEATRQQRSVIASWPALGQRLQRRLPKLDAPVVSLPLVESVASWKAGAEAADAGARVVVVSLSSSNPAATVAAAAAALAAVPDAEVSFCTTTFAYANGARDAARRQGLQERIEWILDPSQVQMASSARGAGTLIWLDHDLRADGRALLMHGLAAGKVTLVPRLELYGDIPEGAVAKVDPGHSMGPEIAAFLGALSSNDALRRDMKEAATAFGKSAPSVVASAADLRDVLTRSADADGLEMVPLSDPVWEALDQDIAGHTIPPSASAPTRRMLSEMIEAATEGMALTGRDGEALSQGAELE